MRRFIRTSRWDDVYQQLDVEEMPWFYSKLDRDVDRALVELRLSRGAALDIGTGPGTQAINLARRDFKVTATDISPTAIYKAIGRAEAAGVKIKFIQDDILYTRLDMKFNLILDRGCFHVLAPRDRDKYAKTVKGLLKADGYLFLKAFSHREPSGQGPYRFKPEEIEEIFALYFRMRSIKDTTFYGNLQRPPKALFCVMQAIK